MPYINGKRIVLPSVKCALSSDSVPELAYSLSDDGECYICNGFAGEPNFKAIIESNIDGKAVLTIAPEAFARIAMLQQVNIPDGLEVIGAAAFAYCINLTNIYIGGNVSHIAADAFVGCNSLLKISYGGTTRDWHSISTIGDGDFRDCLQGKTIYCTDGVIVYGSEDDESATEGLCYSLSDDGAYMICDGFGDNESVADVVIASTYAETEVKVIGFEAFCGNEIIESVHIPNTVEAIAVAAFVACPNLASVKMPNSIREIAEDAFASCNNLTDIYYAGTEAEWNAIETIDLSGADFKDYLANATIHFNYVDESNNECEIADNTLHLSIPSATANIENDVLCVEGSAISANIENDILCVAID